MATRVLNFDVYRPIRAIRADLRVYRYADHPLMGGTSVLTGTKAYRLVPFEFRSLSRHTDVVGGAIFKVLRYTVNTP